MDRRRVQRSAGSAPSRGGALSSWLETVAEALEQAAGSSMTLAADEIDELLRLASFAAHESGAKLNAPLVCFLAGRAGAESELTIPELAALVRAAVAGHSDPALPGSA